MKIYLNVNRWTVKHIIISSTQNSFNSCKIVLLLFYKVWRGRSERRFSNLWKIQLKIVMACDKHSHNYKTFDKGCQKDPNIRDVQFKQCVGRLVLDERFNDG